MKAESWNQNAFCRSHQGELLVLCKAHQTIPDTLSGMELTALLTPPLLNHACYPQSSSLHHLNSLQLQFMPFFSYSCLIRESEQLVTILYIITLGIMEAVTESLFNNSSPGLATQTYLLGNWQRWQVEENTFKTYSHLVKYWIGKLILEQILFLIILPQLMFCNCLKSEAHSIMANDMIFSYNFGLALSEFEIIKSGNPRWKKKKGLDRVQQDIWSKAHVSEIKFES